MELVVACVMFESKKPQTGVSLEAISVYSDQGRGQESRAPWIHPPQTALKLQLLHKLHDKEMFQHVHDKFKLEK